VIAVLGLVLVVGVLVAPAALAAEGPTQVIKQDFANDAAKECVKKLQEGGSIDDCQKAPSPLLPGLNEVIWGTLAFIVLLGVMWKFGVPAVKNMEQAREDRIRNDLEGAEKAKAEAEAEKEQYLAQIAGAKDEAGRLIEEARVAAESVRADLIARAEVEANDIRARAQADIVNQRNQAMTQLRTDVASLSIDLAGRIVERNLDSDTNRQLVDSFIDQVSGSN
jgi:F-type H+-transporting ATPase subunit b